MSGDFKRGALAAAAVILVAYGLWAPKACFGCDALVLAGYAKHADRSHHFNELTWGAGCEWILKENFRAGVMLFDNSNRNATLLGGVAWLPLHAGRYSAGVAGGFAWWGYDSPWQKAGGFTVDYRGRAYGGDATLIPRVLGMKGVVLWLRPKLVNPRWEPLK